MLWDRDGGRRRKENTLVEKAKWKEGTTQGKLDVEKEKRWHVSTLKGIQKETKL